MRTIKTLIAKVAIGAVGAVACFAVAALTGHTLFGMCAAGVAVGSLLSHFDLDM